MGPRERYRDSTGRSLEDYPRPSVAVDTAVLTVNPGSTGRLQLAVLLVRRDHVQPGDAGWALPGTFLHPGETLADAVRRSLFEKAGILRRHPEQLHVFDDPGRDNRGWVLSVAHLDAIRDAELEGARDPRTTTVVPARHPGPLPFDHNDIVQLAVRRLRAAYRQTADPYRLLRSPFTIAQLRETHEAVEGRSVQRDTFRRWALPHLRPTDASSTGGIGRPAQLFRHKPDRGSTGGR